MEAIKQAATCRHSERERTEKHKHTFAVAAHVAKYAVLTAAGVALFKWGQAQAFAERGYNAVGGEFLLLALPLVLYALESVIRDVVRQARGMEEAKHE